MSLELDDICVAPVKELVLRFSNLILKCASDVTRRLLINLVGFSFS